MTKSIRIAAVIVGLIALWMLSGILFNEREIETSVKASDEATFVRAQQLRGETHTRVLTITGSTEALRRVEMKAETEGRVVELPVEKGATVKEGDLICRLSEEDRGANVAEAKALLAQRQLEAEAARKLVDKGFRSATQLAAAEAQLDAARAALSRAEAELANTEIRAPFDGILDDRPAEPGSFLQMGDACGNVVTVDPYLVVGTLAEQDVDLAQTGGTAEVHLITGTKVSGTIRYVAHVANPTTRTFRVEVVVPNADDAFRDGMTARIKIPGNERLAHLISPAFMVLDDKGDIGVRVVGPDSKVIFKPVEIIDESPEGIWISGLNEVEMVITVGNQFVKHGQTVRVAQEDDPESRS